MERFVVEKWHSHASGSKGMPFNHHTCILREAALKLKFCNPSAISSVTHILITHHCTVLREPRWHTLDIHARSG